MNNASISDCILYLASDSIWLPILEGTLLMFSVVAALQDWRFRTSRYYGIGIQVLRGEASMAKFYGAYGAATGILVALALGAEAAERHRTLLVVLNVVLPGYLCLCNAWFRNKLVGWSNALPTLEHR
jgi:hypothetical protein